MQRDVRAESEQKIQGSSLNPEPIVGDLPNKTNLQPNEDNADIDGLLLDTYASQQNISHREIWKQVKSGKLIARTQNGKIYIYSDSIPNIHVTTPESWDAQSKNSTKDQEDQASTGCEFGLPPLPSTTSEQSDKETFLGLSGKFADSPEVALLLDHLSLAKEENREVLRLAQESIRTMTDTTEKVIHAKDQLITEKDRMISQKDELIAEKDRQLELIRQKLADETSKLLKAKQDAEDMETLARTLTTSK